MCMENKVKREPPQDNWMDVEEVNGVMYVSFPPTKVVRSIGFVNREGIRLARIRSMGGK